MFEGSTDFHPEPWILDQIRVVFDDFGYFGRDLARPGTGREALRPAQGLAGRPWPSPYFFFSHETQNSGLLYFRRGVGYPHLKTKKNKYFLFGGGQIPDRHFWLHGLVKVSGQSLAWPSPAQNVGPGPNRQKQSESDPESTVWVENRSRSMPGPLRSVSDRSRDQKKVKSLPKPPQATLKRIKSSDC